VSSPETGAQTAGHAGMTARPPAQGDTNRPDGFGRSRLSGRPQAELKGRQGNCECCSSSRRAMKIRENERCSSWGQREHFLWFLISQRNLRELPVCPRISGICCCYKSHGLALRLRLGRVQELPMKGRHVLEPGSFTPGKPRSVPKQNWPQDEAHTSWSFRQKSFVGVKRLCGY